MHPPSQPRSAPRPWWIALLALLAWLPSTWRAGFAGDDRELLFQNPAVNGALPWSAAFARDYFHHLGDAGQYRPLATLSLRAERAFWSLFELEAEPFGYHLGNALLHALVVLLAGLTLRRIAPPGAWPWFGLAVFAVHPALADAVAWISGRTSMVSALPGVAACLVLATVLRPASAARPFAVFALAAGGTLGALGGKEDGLLFALALAAIGARHSRRALVYCALGASAALALYLLARAQATGSAWPRATQPVLPGAALGERLVLGGNAALEALRLALFAGGHPPQYRPDFLLARAAPLTPALAAALGWWAWLCSALLAAFMFLRGRASLAAASALFAPLALLPVLHLAPLGEAFAPRFLYLPLLFAAPLVHALWSRCPRRELFAWLVLGVLTLGAWQRAGVYADRGAYRLEVLRYMPGDARSWNDLGLAREEAGDVEGALEAWRRATELTPGYSRPWSNLGRVALEAGDYDAAERSLRRAVEAGPANPTARVNLAGLLLRSEHALEASQHYRRATELAPGFAPAWRGLGSALLAGGDRAAAAQAFERALALDPGDERARRLLERAHAD